MTWSSGHKRALRAFPGGLRRGRGGRPLLLGLDRAPHQHPGVHRRGGSDGPRRRYELRGVGVQGRRERHPGQQSVAASVGKVQMTPESPGFDPPIITLEHLNHSLNNLKYNKNDLERPKTRVEVFDPPTIILQHLNPTYNALKYHVLMDPPTIRGYGRAHSWSIPVSYEQHADARHGAPRDTGAARSPLC